MQARMGRPPLGDKAKIQQSIALNPEQWKQVEAARRKMGYDSTSATVRRIVAEWWELRGQKLVGTGELLMMDIEEAVSTTP